MGRSDTSRTRSIARAAGAGSQVGEQFVRLLEIALASGTVGAERYARSLVKSLGADNGPFVSAIQDVLHAAPSVGAPFRSSTIAAIPVDSDSRMQLIKYENPVILERDPLLPQALRDDLEQIIRERQILPELRGAGISPTRSALFHGAPGVGKTLAARWLAREMGVPLLILDLSSVMSSFLGRTGVNIRNVLDYAKGVKCVLLLDEVDAIAKRRDDLAEIGELKRLVTVLLQEIDNWPDSGLLIAATNHPELLDRAIWRRFDMVLHFEVPSEELMAAAISRVLPELATGDLLLRLLTVIYAGSAISDVERDLQRLRRRSMLSALPLADLIKSLIQTRIKGESRTVRIELARRLVPAGLSQREAHELTGVSRDTLRKKP